MFWCKITGCNHKRKHKTKKFQHSWELLGICNCCAVELTLMGTLTGYEGYGGNVGTISSNNCRKAIREELKIIVND